MPNYITAFAKSNRIPTPNGWTFIKNLKPGDLLFNKAGRPVAIKTTKTVDTLGMLITMSDGRKYVCSEYAKLDESGYKISDAMEYLKTHEQYYNRPIQFYRTIALPALYTKNELPIHPYIIGLLCATNAKPNKNGIIDIELSRPIRKYIRENIPPEHLKTAKRHERTLINTKPLSKNAQITLRKLPNGIPNEYLTSCVKDRIELLSGIIDAIGRPTALVCKLNGLTPKTIKSVIELIYSLGLPAKQILPENEIHILSNNLPTNLRTNKSAFQKMHPQSNAVQIRIQRIEHLGYVKSAQITLEHETDNFLIENYVPVML